MIAPAEAFEVRIQQDRGQESVTVKGFMPDSLKMDAQSQWEAPFSQGLMGMLPGAVSSALRMFGVRPVTQLMTLQVWQSTEVEGFSFDLDFITESDPIVDVYQPVLALLSMVVPSLGEGGMIISPGPTLDPTKARDLMGQVISHGKEVGSAGMALMGQFTQGVVGAGASLMGALGTGSEADKLRNPSTEVPAVKEYRKATQGEARSMKNGLRGSLKNSISVQFGKFLYMQDAVVIAASPDWDLSYMDGQLQIPSKCTVSVVVRPLFMVTTQDLADMFTIINSPSVGRGNPLLAAQQNLLSKLGI